MLCTVCVGVLLSILGARPPELGVEITVTGPASPFVLTRLEARVRRGTAIAGYSRRFQPPFGHQEGVGVVTPKALMALMEGLEADGLFTLKAALNKRHRLRYRVVAVGLGGEVLDVTVDDPWQTRRPRLLRALARLRRFIDSAAKPSQFVDPMLLPAESGRLRLVSTPPATVTIDGAPLTAPTPTGPVRLVGGVHSVEFTALDGSLKERYEVRVEIGKTTTLDVKLSADPRKDTP